MACRRCLRTLTRHTSAILTSKPQSPSLPPLKTLTSQLPSIPHPHFHPNRTFSSRVKDNNNPPRIVDDAEQDNDDDDDDEEEDDDDISDEESDGEINDEDGVPSPVGRAYSLEDKIKEAADIGYKVVGPITPKGRVFKPYEPVFAVVQIGSHQFKVSNGDWIYVEKLKFCDVNDKIILNKVLMVGSPTQTIIGRPILPDAAVHAVVEEHALDAKVIIFKKKRRKNYRRTNGHRQELTRLRIADIEGIEKPVTPPPSPSRKAVKTPSKKPAKEPVAT